MTTNEELKKLMEERGLDTRPDPRSNRDVDRIAESLSVGRRTVINWLSPPHWTSHRKMAPAYLELLKIKLGQL
jgi:hypothetical protein